MGLEVPPWEIRSLFGGREVLLVLFASAEPEEDGA